MSLRDDLTDAAEDEIARAVTQDWRQLSKHLPWGDTFEGISPEGRDVCFERTYLWDDAAGGDIRVEVTVFEPRAYEGGVKRTRSIPRPLSRENT